jgi:excisionase family DNA binding protein
MIQPSVKSPTLLSGRTGQMASAIATARAELSTDPLLTLAEVRAVLHCSYGTIDRLIRKGFLRTWQAVPHGTRRIRQSVLRAYLESGDHE